MKGNQVSFSLEDLQEQHREIAEVIGIENMVKLSEVFGGSSIYIPQKRELLKNRIYKAISEEFDGGNIKKLAAKYQVSEATIYKIVKEQITQGKRYDIPGQFSLADYGI